VEDPVRILRVARFAACLARYGFHVAHGTNALMREMVDNGEVDHLVPERVWAELRKALACDTPTQFFAVLLGCGALARLFPEIDRLQTPSAKRAHDKPRLQLPVLDSATVMSGDTAIRFAALVCDLDNGCADGFSIAGLDSFCDRLRVPNGFRELAGMVLRHRAQAHGSVSLTAAALLELLMSLDAFRRGERLADFIAVCAADARATDTSSHDYPPAALLERAYQAAATVKADTQGMTGKEIGAALREQRIAAIAKVMA
jgi:tRNA nucleotidyltransferase (CCA-adding enzyme)